MVQFIHKVHKLTQYNTIQSNVLLVGQSMGLPRKKQADPKANFGVHKTKVGAFSMTSASPSPSVKSSASGASSKSSILGTTPAKSSKVSRDSLFSGNSKSFSPSVSSVPKKSELSAGKDVTI